MSANSRSAILSDVITRDNIPLNSQEQEVMALILRKYFSDQIAGIIGRIKPELAATIKNVQSLRELRSLFPVINRIINDQWITEDSFFMVGWQDFIEISKKSYLQINRQARISQIRPGALVKNITRSNFHGIMLTMDYCTMDDQVQDFNRTYEFALRYFSLSFERNPDEVLAEIRFANHPAVQESLTSLISLLLKGEGKGARELQKDEELRRLFSKAGADPARLLLSLKRFYYLSLIYNHAVVRSGNRTSMGWVNGKNELLSFDHPQVHSAFRAVTREAHWLPDEQDTELILGMNMWKNQSHTATRSLLPNLYRCILECVRQETPLLMSNSPLRSKVIKQGLLREANPDKYFQPVIDFVLSHQQKIRDIIISHKGQ